MRFALVGDIRAEAQPSLTGKCGCCGSGMISKCGNYVRWHWAHRPRTDCDPWHETETIWHLMWKDAFPTDCQEIVQIDENTGEKHVADVKTPGGVVVEVQHSRISDDELQSREDFYGEMIWIVDARDIIWITSRDLVSIAPMSYGVKLLTRSTLLKRWWSAQRPVYFDNTLPVLYDKDLNQLLPLPSETSIPVSDRVIWRMLEYHSEENTGRIAPVPAAWLIKAAMNGRRVPLPKCGEENAWRYRMEMAELATGGGDFGDSLEDGEKESQVAPKRQIVGDDDLPF